MITKSESPLEMESNEEHKYGKLFENYIDVNVRESIGTIFLGVLAILLLISLQRSWNRYEGLYKQERMAC